MKYILTETEYQEILASKKQAHEFLTLKEQALHCLGLDIEGGSDGLLSPF